MFEDNMLQSLDIFQYQQKTEFVAPCNVSYTGEQHIYYDNKRTV